MRTTISSKNISISDSLNDWLDKKVSKLDRYLRDNTEVQVKLTQQTPSRNCAEITIHLDGTILRVEETGVDMYTCIDKAADKIVRQIRRHHTKLDKRLRAGAFEQELDEPIFDDQDDQNRELVRTKRFVMKPMSVEDAIAQMEMLGHSFFMFLNEETQGTCVVYKRADGNYGLLLPENA